MPVMTYTVTIEMTIAASTEAEAKRLAHVALENADRTSIVDYDIVDVKQGDEHLV